MSKLKKERWKEKNKISNDVKQQKRTEKKKNKRQKGREDDLQDGRSSADVDVDRHPAKPRTIFCSDVSDVSDVPGFRLSP